MSDNEWERIGASIDAAVEGRVKPPASDTTDLRTQVQQALRKCEYKNAYGDDALVRMADAALEVAEPIIRADERRKVIEDLIAEAESGSGEACGLEHSVTLADWLRAQQENDQ